MGGATLARYASGTVKQVEETRRAVVRTLLELGEREEVVSGAYPQLTTDPDANALLVNDPFAFLLAVVGDYQIPAERAWALPYLLAQRLGHLDPVRMLAEPEAVHEAFMRRPALHRFVHTVPKFMLGACAIVMNHYDGDASAIWSDRPTAVELQERLRRFPGVSQKKAAMAVEMIERDLGIPIADMTGSDVAIDVHVRRVFLRAGLVERDSAGEIVAAARVLYPERPGALDLPAWIVGRSWCKARDPLCDECALGDVCPRLVERGDGVKGA
jgi:uncharacterized HhH-GPD family protein